MRHAPRGQPAPPPLTEDAGPAARFKLGRQIGQGGNGAVYAARDRETGDTVALKFLSRGADVDPTACARFLRETCTLAQVHDPHVVDVLEVGVYEGSPFLAMEWIAGESLQDRVYDDRTATPEEALGLARGLAHALAAISRAGLVHRDLKPANVMLRDGRFDQPVLIDFGLAKRPDDRSLTISGCLLGTPGYIAPEVANGASPSPQSDVFGLGAVVRFALCGQHVFPGLGGYRLIEAIAMQPIDVPRCGHPGLRALLEDLLSRDLARRPKSAGEVLERLERLAPVGGSASSQTSELGYRAKPTVVVRRPRATEAVDGGSAPSPADNHS